MKTPSSPVFFLVGLVLWTGCKEQPAQLPLPPEPAGPKPVVVVPPIPTKPFEDGYEAGFQLGKEKGAPRARMPEVADVQRLAGEQAAGHPERNERWERGFADGYMDGFRNVVTGQK